MRGNRRAGHCGAHPEPLCAATSKASHARHSRAATRGANEIVAYADQWHQQQRCAIVKNGTSRVGPSAQGGACTPGSGVVGARGAASFTRIASH
eukprot:scaffold3767_cov242-Prasinococcus_capsulatus_cf.AAC.14